MCGKEPNKPHLGCNVIWGSTKRSCCFVIKDPFLAHAVISDLDVAFGVQHHIVQLQISEEAAQKIERASMHVCEREEGRVRE